MTSQVLWRGKKKKKEGEEEKKALEATKFPRGSGLILAKVQQTDR